MGRTVNAYICRFGCCFAAKGGLYKDSASASTRLGRSSHRERLYSHQFLQHISRYCSALLQYKHFNTECKAYSRAPVSVCAVCQR